MYIVLNPVKPMYIDRGNNSIRMGNFKCNGKEVLFETEDILKLFLKLKKPILKDELIMQMKNETNNSTEEIIEVLDYLMYEGFIIDYESYQNLLKDEKYNRQNLYFYMLSNSVIKNVSSDKKVLILGVGGIGSIVMELLVRSGFEDFTIVDNDVVEQSNLIRQLAYFNDDINKLKVDAMRDNMLKINSKLKIETVNRMIFNETDILDKIKNTDFVVCTLDRPLRKIRRVINNACVQLNKPVLFTGFSEHVAMVGPFVVPGESACLNCIENGTLDEYLDNIKVIPSYGPLCTLIASIAVNEIINYFIKFRTDNLIGKTLMFDMNDYDIKIESWTKNKKCKICGDKHEGK